MPIFPEIDAKADSHIQIYFGANDFLYLLIGTILLRKKAKKEELIQLQAGKILKRIWSIRKRFREFYFSGF